jgi:hypothetical protein
VASVNAEAASAAREKSLAMVFIVLPPSLSDCPVQSCLWRIRPPPQRTLKNRSGPLLDVTAEKAESMGSRGRQQQALAGLTRPGHATRSC